MPYYGRTSRPNGLRPGQHRDNRRQRLYNAEQVLRNKRPSVLGKRHLTDSQRHGYIRQWVRVNPDDEHATETRPLYYPATDSVQDYVDAVLATAWFRRRWGYQSISVSHSHGSGSHAFDHGVIEMGCEHRRSESVILHEIAHILTPWPYAHHGPEFAATLLTLVKHQMGAEHATALRESFTSHGVKYRTGMAAVPKPEESRRARADHTAKRRGEKVRKTTRRKAVTPTTRKPPKRLETEEEMYEAGRAAALRGSDWDRAESSAISRAAGDMRFRAGRRAFSRGFGEIRDMANRGEIDDPMR